jgi:hyaluronoglucosaminidase
MRLARIPITMVMALVAVASLVAIAPSASASPYFTGCSLSISTPTVVVGQQLSVTASGYPTGSVVTFTLHSTPVVLGSATADASGNATLVFTLPVGTTPGLHQITANGVPLGECDPDVSTDLMVDAATVTTASVTTGTLPRTGTNSAELVQVALVLIAVGGLITLATRKRRQSHVSS